MAAADFVIGVDSSTTATKCIAWGPDGSQLAEGRMPVALSNPAPGIYEQDPCTWRESLYGALADLATKVDLGSAQALAISNQRETVGFVNDKGESVRPGIVWLDERCRANIDPFAQSVGDDEIHRLTGKHKDLTPVIYRLAWMREHEPDNFDNVACFVDVQAYLVHCLSGKMRTSWASADPFGCWDICAKQWSMPILEKLGLDGNRFAEALQPGEVLAEVSPESAAQTGLKAGLPIVGGGGDGQCAGLGMNVTAPGSAYINIGTALVCGCFSSDYHHNRAWRTMTSLTGDDYIFESIVRTGTFLVDWLVKEVFGGDASLFAKLEPKARELPPGSSGLLVMPYWSGVMNPHWNTQASGCMLGLTEAHRREHLYRAVLEGIALELTLGTSKMEQASGIATEQFHAVGGGAKSDLWCQIIADVTGKPVSRSSTVEASALGAGMAAACGCGWYDSMAAAAATMGGKVESRFEPQPEVVAAYAEVLAIYADMYGQVSGLTDRLASLRQ